MTGLERPRSSGGEAEVTAMVVDDDRDTASVLSQMLHIKGISVIGEAHGGSEAIEMFKEQRPDVVFLDVMMERGDGFYTLRRMREIQPDAIIILITGDEAPATSERLERLGASSIIYKPYDIGNVMEITNKLVITLKQRLLGEINYKKALLKRMNFIIEGRMHESDTSKLRLLEFFKERQDMV